MTADTDPKGLQEATPTEERSIAYVEAFIMAYIKENPRSSLEEIQDGLEGLDRQTAEQALRILFEKKELVATTYYGNYKLPFWDSVSAGNEKKYFFTPEQFSAYQEFLSRKRVKIGDLLKGIAEEFGGRFTEGTLSGDTRAEITSAVQVKENAMVGSGKLNLSVRDMTIDDDPEKLKKLNMALRLLLEISDPVYVSSKDSKTYSEEVKKRFARWRQEVKDGINAVLGESAK